MPHRCRLVDVTVTLKAQHSTSSPRQTTPLTHLTAVLPVNDRKRSPILQRKVILCPVLGLVFRRCPTAHNRQLSRWIHVVNPRGAICACMDAPLVQEISERFECVIGCGHVSVDRQAICETSLPRGGPLVAAVDTAAGRYGAARTKGRSTNRAHKLLHKDCFIWSGSFRSFALTVHRSPHTLKSRGAIHGALRSCHRCRRGSVVLLFCHHGP